VRHLARIPVLLLRGERRATPGASAAVEQAGAQPVDGTATAELHGEGALPTPPHRPGGNR
jgi:hypothetical protein